MIEERWEVLSDFPDYMISDKGNVLSLLSGRVLKQSSRRYKEVCLCKDGKKSTKLVHRLVAKTFIPNPLNKREVNHIDFDKQNNSASNLEWTTHTENRAHSEERRRGSVCKLSEESVLLIREHLEEATLNQREIAEIFGINSRTVSQIKNRQRWSWL